MHREVWLHAQGGVGWDQEGVALSDIRMQGSAGHGDQAGHGDRAGVHLTLARRRQLLQTFVPHQASSRSLEMKQ